MSSRTLAVSVVIPTYKRPDLLSACLSAVQASIAKLRAEVIVVDDAPGEWISESATSSWPLVRVLRNEVNLGYAAATNRGIAAARGEFVALLNNDTIVDRDWLNICLEFMKKHPDVGSCAPLVRFLSNRNVINSAGIEVDWSGIARERLGGRDYGCRDSHPVEVFGASGTAAVYRRDVLEQLGGYEPRFWAYLEDVDLAWRARRAGWKSFHLPAAQVIHAHSATMKQGSEMKAFQLSRNRVWLVLRNASWRQISGGLPKSLAFDLGVIAYNAFRRGSLAPVRGKLAALERNAPIREARRDLPLLEKSAFSRIPLRELLGDRRRRDALAYQGSE